MKISDIKSNPKNPRKITDSKLNSLKKSLETFGDLGGIVFNVRSNQLVGGHQRVKTLSPDWKITKSPKKDKTGTVAVGSIETPWGNLSYREVDWDGNKESLANIAANKHGGDFINTDLTEIISGLKEFDDIDLSLTGFDTAEIDYMLNYGARDNSGSLTKDFGAPPFTVIDGRSGEWLENKRIWKMKFDGGAGREDDLLFSKNSAINSIASATSIFDPMLAEVLYRFFCKDNGLIFDPFCGGVTRGFVAGTMGYKYVGVDVRKEQIDANIKQVLKLKNVKYILGDSEFCEIPSHDFLFTCPPYLNIEKYSEQKDDISTLDVDLFVKKYERIIFRSCEKLAKDGFAVFVVSDIRSIAGDDKGFYKDFIGMTISAFKKAGLGLYNKAVYLSPLASAAFRASQFKKIKKLVKCHEEILCFKRA